MKYKRYIYLLMLVLALAVCQASRAAPYFSGTGVVNIPTAYVDGQGIFDTAIHVATLNQKVDERLFRVDLGFLHFAELGLMELRKQSESYVLGNVKILLARESGITPALSIGVDNLGEKPHTKTGEFRRSLYAVMSKQFNLPFLHLIGGHLGIGNRRYVAEESAGKYLHGIFMGLDKDFYLRAADSRLRVMLEFDGKEPNIGLQYIMTSGLSVYIATGQLTSAPKDVKYYLGIGFTNESMLKKADMATELAKRAVRIANRSGSDSVK